MAGSAPARHGTAGAAGLGEARLASAGHGTARRGSIGTAWLGQAWSGRARRGLVRHGSNGRAWWGTAWHDSVGHGMVRQSRPGLARHGTARLAAARQERQGEVWHGRAWPGRPRQEWQGLVGQSSTGMARQARMGRARQGGARRRWAGHGMGHCFSDRIRVLLCRVRSEEPIALNLTPKEAKALGLNVSGSSSAARPRQKRTVKPANPYRTRCLTCQEEFSSAVAEDRHLQSTRHARYEVPL